MTPSTAGKVQSQVPAESGEDDGDDYGDDGTEDDDDYDDEDTRRQLPPTPKPTKKPKKHRGEKKAAGKNRREELPPLKPTRKPRKSTTTTTTEASGIDFPSIIPKSTDPGQSVFIVDKGNSDNAELLKAIQSVLRGYNQMYNLNWSLDDELRLQSPSEENTNRLDGNNPNGGDYNEEEDTDLEATE